MAGEQKNVHRVLVAPRIHQKGLDILEARPDVSYEVLEDISEASLQRAFTGIDAAVVRAIPIGRSVLEKAPDLKVVSRHGVGYNDVDIDYLNEKGIPLAITVDANAISVAEQTLFFILALARNAIVYDRATRENRFRIRESLGSHDISGKTLVLVGFGRIGRAVAARARAFGMEIVAYDPVVPAEAIAAAGCTPAASLEEALPQADYLSVHIPLLPATKGLIGAGEIALMKPTASIINTARGGIVSEAALVEALTTGRIASAALDVFEKEPPDPDNPLLGLDNVILSPHSAGLTMECAVRMAVDSVNNALAVIDGAARPETVVNRHVLDA